MINLSNKNLISAVVIFFAQSSLCYAHPEAATQIQRAWRAHKQAQEAKRTVTRAVFNGAVGPHTIIASFLDRRSQAQLAQVDRVSRSAVREAESARIQAENERLAGTPFLMINKFKAVDEGVVSARFAGVGGDLHDNLIEVAGLIWSNVAPKTMNHRDAQNFCVGLGGGARLPTKDEYRALSQAMGSGQPEVKAPGFDVTGYRIDHLPTNHRRWFWSATAHPLYSVDAFVLSGQNGSISTYARLNHSYVRCVLDAPGARGAGGKFEDRAR